VAGAPWSSLGLAVCTTALSFFALSFYDVFAVRSVARGQVPDRITGLAGATGTAISNLRGFSYLTGTAVRYRIYAALGLDLSRVAGVIATAWVGFWLGPGLMIAVLPSFHSVGLSGVLPIGPDTETAAGLVIPAGLAVLFLWLARGGRRFAFGGFAFDLPHIRLAGALTAVAVFDLTMMAATL